MRALILSTLCLISVLLRAEVSKPLFVPAAELSKHVYQIVSIRGVVRDAFADERDKDYGFLLITTDTGPVYAAINITIYKEYKNYTSFIGAEVIATGRCNPSIEVPTGQPRRYLGYFIVLQGQKRDGLHIIAQPPSDPFDVPAVEDNTEINPHRLQQLGRRRLIGRVLAVWGKRNLLVQAPSNFLSRIELAEEHAPAVGSFVEAVGFVDTDLYRINLTRAIWRMSQSWTYSSEPVLATSAAKILTDGDGHALVDTTMYGKTIQLSGIIQSLPRDSNDNVIRIDNDGYSIPIDISNCPTLVETLSVGCLIRATGICILDIGNCRPNDAFPQVKGFTLIVNDHANVTILQRPSWWTPSRLSLTLGILLGLLVAILIWNRSLSVLAERRGRQLAEEQVGRATSELKVLERTRFSAELHDALSQTLSGIAMQLGAIKRLARTDPAQMLRHLDIASRTLKSCRDEMRNLLWDLRSQVLDEPDIEKALRQILEPHLDETEVHIRFAVPRTRLTDSTARALFCIVRELTVNAIRHGRASAVRIAGSLENGRLLCSVRDNGCGFDPSTAPGAEEGHFGLQGIRERMDALNGTVTIESARDRGTKVTISLAAPHEEEKT